LTPAILFFGGVLVFVASAHVVNTLETLGATFVYRKDLLQDYLAARAVMDGKDPYQPMTVLRAAYLKGVVGALEFPHPTPHPPPAVLLTLPLGLTTYPRAAAAWLFLEYFLLVGCAVLVARRVMGKESKGAPLALAVLSLATCPVRNDLVLGQISVVILALVTGAYLALTVRREVLGGLLLGAAVSLKFVCWPLVLFYAWKRRWGVVLGAAAALLVTHAACAVVMPGAIFKYYTVVAPRAGEDYWASDRNISVWTLGQRCFGGLHSQVTVNAVNAPPFFELPSFASRAGMIVAAATFLFFMCAAAKLSDQCDGFLVMLSASTVLNPIAWEIYLTLLFLPLAVVGHRLAQRSWPPRASAVFVGLLITLIALKTPQAVLIGDGMESNVTALRAIVTAVPMLWPLTTAWAVIWSASPVPGASRLAGLAPGRRGLTPMPVTSVRKSVRGTRK